MTCLSCYATTSNGLALCEQCQIAASVVFEFLPIYFRNLARWRPGRAGGRRVPSSREPVGPVAASPDRVSRTLDEVGAQVTTWARCLADDREVELPQAAGEAEDVAALCRLFSAHLTSIATTEWAGEFLRDMRESERRLRGLTETVAPGWYAGACRQCSCSTYVVPGLTWVTCGSCGVTTYARDHLDVLIDEARGWIAPPKRIAEALVALLDSEQSVVRLHERIKKWEQRGHVVGVRRIDADGDEVGPKRYRLGEVLDVLQREGQTRMSDVATKAG